MLQKVLLKITAIIQDITNYKELIDALLVHTCIAQNQHKALIEEKKRENFDNIKEEDSFKRQIWKDKACKAASQELPTKNISRLLEEKTNETKDEGKSTAFKILLDIERATNLKEMLEEYVLNIEIEFPLKEILGIIKEFYNVIIENIKKKRKLIDEVGMNHAINVRIYKDKKEVDNCYKKSLSERNGYNQ